PWALILFSGIGKAGDVEFVASMVGRFNRRWPGVRPMISEQWEAWGWLVVMLGGFGWLWWTGRQRSSERTVTGFREGGRAEAGDISPADCDRQAVETLRTENEDLRAKLAGMQA